MSAPLASKRQKNHLSPAVLTRRSTVMQREFQCRRSRERAPIYQLAQGATAMIKNTLRCLHHTILCKVDTSWHIVRPPVVESGQLSPCGNCQEAFGEHRKSLNGMESDEELAFPLFIPPGSVLWKHLSPSHVNRPRVTHLLL